MTINEALRLDHLANWKICDLQPSDNEIQDSKIGIQMLSILLRHAGPQSMQDSDVGVDEEYYSQLILPNARFECLLWIRGQRATT